MKMGNVGRWAGGLMIQIMDEDGKWMDEGREHELMGVALSSVLESD